MIRKNIPEKHHIEKTTTKCLPLIIYKLLKNKSLVKIHGINR